jgi:hypothetical protein
MLIILLSYRFVCLRSRRAVMAKACYVRTPRQSVRSSVSQHNAAQAENWPQPGPFSTLVGCVLSNRNPHFFGYRWNVRHPQVILCHSRPAQVPGNPPGGHHIRAEERSPPRKTECRSLTTTQPNFHSDGVGDEGSGSQPGCRPATFFVVRINRGGLGVVRINRGCRGPGG